MKTKRATEVLLKFVKSPDETGGRKQLCTQNSQVACTDRCVTLLKK